MRILLSAYVFVLAATSLSAQVWREPYFVNHLVKPLNVAGAPVELGEGTVWLGRRLDSLDITLRARAPGRYRTAVTGIRLRLAAGPLPDGMITFRLEPARTATADILSFLPDGDGEWASMRFERLAADPPPPTLAVKRESRIFVTVERVLSAAGEVLWENTNSRELLWQALNSASTQ
jgi:hypothetical protein